VNQHLRDELHRYAAVSAYLFVCFAVMLFLKGAVLRESGQDLLPLGLAAGKALVLGKFFLLGEAARVGLRVKARTLLQSIAQRVVLFTILLVVLTIIEELIIGRVHGHSISETLGELRQQHSMLEVLAKCLMMLVVLVPLVTVTEVSRVLGPGALRRLLLGPAVPATEAGSQATG
jgi:hypothetical protein